MATDGFPTGQDSPEGAAADGARAFVTADKELWRRVCYPPSAVAGPKKEEYSKFVDHMASCMDDAKRMGASKAGGPKRITKVYKVRDLSNPSGPSFGYAFMRLLETKFVDVETEGWDGKLFTARSLVVQREDDKRWYFIPAPESFPLLAPGLNAEAESTQVWEAPKDAPRPNP
ncbi:MAG: hypothetical protein K2Q20_08510 [Phycisphaerales bacterium]|nr:hypothetical protein [Phycisphaerales bacterium]